MKLKKYFFLMGAIMLFNWAQAQQAEIVIEVKTDAYPNETSLKLYSLGGDVRAESSSFELDEYNYDTILVSSDSCFYWTIFDTYGDGMGGNANNGTPGYAIYLDGEKIIESSSPQFGKQISECGIGR